MKLVFCGTPEFAVPTLEKLLTEEFEVELVMANPDEPSGRGYSVKPPPVKQAAQTGGVAVFQPAKLKDPTTQAVLSRHQPDAIVVVAYGHIIPPWMIDLPRLGCINLHASLLPKYRGAAPIQWALIRGEKTTGVTTMKIDAGLDTGDILLQRETEILDSDTTETLSERLSHLGADLMLETLRSMEQGKIAPREQDHQLATRAPMLRKEDGRIDWWITAEEVWGRIRGLRPWPGAYTRFRNKILHLWNAVPVQGDTPATHEPGSMVTEQRKLLVACGQGTWVEITELQLEGRKRISARDFLNGMHPTPGEKLG